MNKQDKSLFQRNDIIFLAVILGVLICICVLGFCIISLAAIGNFKAQSANPITFIQLTPTSSPCPPVRADWAVKVEDRFDDNHNHWPIGNELRANIINVSEIREITGGKYRIQATARGSANRYFYPSMDYEVHDFYLMADVRQVEGPLYSLYGLNFRISPHGDQYFFGIRDTQRYTLSQVFEDQRQTLISPTYSPLIRPGETNQLVVVASGPHFVLCINQIAVAEIENADITQGKAGFSYSLIDEGDEATFEFDNFLLYTPPPSE
jgi:hypothetical protein